MKKQRAQDHPLYYTWKGMHDRCRNDPNYSNVSVCPSWHGIAGFWKFVEDMGHRPEGYTLDRIDNSKGYSKENCRWADKKEQANNRAVTIRLSCGTPLIEWCRGNNKNYNTIAKRLRLGWEEKKALTTPCAPFKRKEKPHYLHSRWSKIKSRCYNIDDPAFYDYGGRGIKMCPTWVDDFEKFKNDIVTKLGHPEEGQSLDRKKVNSSYLLCNLKWATKKEQNSNRRNNIRLPDGRLFKDVCKENGIDYNLAYMRYKRGDWNMKDACTLPVGSKNPKRKPPKNALYLPDGRLFIDVCAENGIHPNVAHTRRSRGMGLVDACTLPLGYKVKDQKPKGKRLLITKKETPLVEGAISYFTENITSHREFTADEKSDLDEISINMLLGRVTYSRRQMDLILHCLDIYKEFLEDLKQLKTCQEYLLIDLRYKLA